MATLNGKEVNPSNWLKAEDLDYGTRVVHIESASWEEVGEEKQEKVVLHFVNNSKGLVLNKTNTLTIEAILGKTAVEDWTGQAIELYVEKVPFKGQIYDAIRVRQVSPSAPLPSGAPASDEVVEEIPY